MTKLHVEDCRFYKFFKIHIQNIVVKDTVI